MGPVQQGYYPHNYPQYPSPSYGAPAHYNQPHMYAPYNTHQGMPMGYPQQPVYPQHHQPVPKYNLESETGVVIPMVPADQLKNGFNPSTLASSATKVLPTKERVDIMDPKFLESMQVPALKAIDSTKKDLDTPVQDSAPGTLAEEVQPTSTRYKKRKAKSTKKDNAEKDQSDQDSSGKHSTPPKKSTMKDLEYTEAKDVVEHVNDLMLSSSINIKMQIRDLPRDVIGDGTVKCFNLLKPTMHFECVAYKNANKETMDTFFKLNPQQQLTRIANYLLCNFFSEDATQNINLSDDENVYDYAYVTLPKGKLVSIQQIFKYYDTYNVEFAKRQEALKKKHVDEMTAKHPGLLELIHQIVSETINDKERVHSNDADFTQLMMAVEAKIMASDQFMSTLSKCVAQYINHPSPYPQNDVGNVSTPMSSPTKKLKVAATTPSKTDSNVTTETPASPANVPVFIAPPNPKSPCTTTTSEVNANPIQMIQHTTTSDRNTTAVSTATITNEEMLNVPQPTTSTPYAEPIVEKHDRDTEKPITDMLMQGHDDDDIEDEEYSQSIDTAF